MKNTLKFILIIFILYFLNYINCLFPSSLAEITSLSTGSQFQATSQIINTLICDINGDDKPDVIVTDYSTSGVLVFFGYSDQFTRNTSSPTAFDGYTNGFSISMGPSYNTQCGDVNNDGFDDLLISSDTPGSGIVAVIYGSNQSFPASLDPVTYATDTNGSRAFYAYGESGTEQLMGFTKSKGDVNGDGILDFIFGSNVGTTGTNISYILFGINGGVYPTTNGSFDLTSFNGVNGFSIIDVGVYNIGCGDINNDGYDDIIIQGTIQTEVPIIFGGASFSSTLGTMSPSFNGTQAIKIFVSFSLFANPLNIFGVGDFNGDSLNDLVMTTKKSDNTFAVFVLYGRTEYPATMTLPTYLDGTTGIVFESYDAFTSCLCFSARLFDINGDGIADIQCFGYPLNYWVVFGSPKPLPQLNILTLPSNPTSIFNSAQACQGFTMTNTHGGFNNGDINGDNIVDIIIPSSSPYTIAYAVYGSIYYKISSSSNALTINKTTTTAKYQLFTQIVSIESTGSCQPNFITLQVLNPVSGDSLEFNNPNELLYSVSNNNINNTYLSIYSITPNTLNIEDILPFLHFNSGDNNVHTTISISLNGVTEIIVDLIEVPSVPPITTTDDTTGLTSGLTTGATAGVTTGVTTDDTTGLTSGLTSGLTTGATTGTTTSTSETQQESSETPSNATNLFINSFIITHIFLITLINYLL